MKRTVFQLVTIALFSLSASVHAAEGTDGTVNFTGTILDTPCTISGDAGNVDVDMQSVSAGKVANNTAPKIPFNIKLSDCATSIKKSVQVTFSGNATAQGALELNGEAGSATNVAIQLFQNDKALSIGTISDQVTLKDGDTDLPFAAQYIATGGVPVAGKGNAIAQFTLTYL